MKLCHHFFFMWGNLFCVFLSQLQLFLLWRFPLSIHILDQCSFYCTKWRSWIRGSHVMMPNYQLAIRETHSQTDIIIQLCESQKSCLSLMLAPRVTSKWLEFISYHFTLMTAQFDHSPILWGKQMKPLFAFQGHLSFLCLSKFTAEIKRRG